MRLADWSRRLPWSIVLMTLALLSLSWLGIARCEELTDGSGRFLRQQVVFSVLGVAVMLGLSVPDYRFLAGYSYLVYLLSLVLLMVVYAFPAVNNAHRWIRVGPVGLQPSEVAKVALVLALAKYLMWREDYRRLRGLAIPLGIALVPALLIVKEPDLGSAVLLLPVCIVMLFAAGARRGDLALIVGMGVLLSPLLWTQMSREQRSRVVALFDQPPADGRPSDDAYHLHQAKRMLALGGGWGSLLNGAVTDDLGAYRLPEARTDFIFCVLGERLGLPGLGAVLILYGMLAWRGLSIAASTREPYGRLVAVGIVALVAVEVLVNTGMTVGILPVTGLPLPLVSYGGSGVLAHCMALGLLLNIGLRPGYDVTAEPFQYRLR